MQPRQSKNEDSSISDVLENYEHMSLGRFTHASPTMFNAGLVQKQMSSCFVLFPDTGVRGVLKCQYQVHRDYYDSPRPPRSFSLLLPVCRETPCVTRSLVMNGHWIAGRTHQHACGRHRHGYPWTAFPRSRCAGLAGVRKDDAHRRAERGQAKRTDVRLHRAVQVRSDVTVEYGVQRGADTPSRPVPSRPVPSRP